MESTQKLNFAARAGRWSAQHRKKAIIGWLAFVILASAIGAALGTKTFAWQDNGPGESGRADKAIYHAFPKHASETVLVQAHDGSVGAARGSRGAVDSPVFRATVADVQARLAKTAHVSNIEGPYARGNQGRISRDGRSVLVGFDVGGDYEGAKKNVDAPLAAVAAAQKAHPALRIEEFGDASSGKAIDQMFKDDMKKSEQLSLPITLAILLLAFGALVAAGVPLLLGISAVAGTLGLVGIVSQVLPVDQSISSIVLLIGLAVGVDYSLFYVRREREEREAGRDADAALQAAAATSGRAILISGFTVIVAMSGMFLTGLRTFSSFAVGTIMVVGVAMIGSITVLPAILSKLGDRVEKGRVPLLHRVRSRSDSRAWSAILDRVLRRPALSAGVALAILVTLSLPAFGLKMGVPGTEALPRSLPVMNTYDRIQAAFPGGPLPAIVAVQADDVRSPQVKAAISDLTRRAVVSGDVRQPVQVAIAPNHKLARISLPLAGDGANARSQEALVTLRNDVLPATVGRVDGADYAVSGMAAQNKDFNDLMSSRVPIVMAFVLSMAFLLLLVTFRSIVIPIKAIVLNMLSVGAAYGILVFLFQNGHGEKLLGFHSTGTVTSWLPLFLFVVLFGLSMDYHVFILSRVREAFDRGMRTDEAVAYGIKQTAGVVTSAAIVMVAVFGIFATLTSVELKQMGVGLATAVLIDATIVRAVLLPATMQMLGEWNWYLPRWLEWLPRMDAEPSVGGDARVGKDARVAADPRIEPACA
ncbi:MAG TPA: MMPL family transporter [Thermoleophilaceae bacterium]|nr:MMPL family transporter [Thermoleophilaceae bacterium]